MSESPACLRCGYDLRGVGDDSPCPECGLLAGRSRRLTDSLRDARPRWLLSLSAGVWIILLVLALATLWSLVGVPYMSMASWRLNKQVVEFLGMIPDPRTGRMILMNVGYVVAGLLLPIGAFLLTRPEGFEPADRADRWRRRWIRSSAFVPVLALVGMLANRGLSRNYVGAETNVDSLFIVALASLTIGVTPLPALGFAQLRSLAKRAGSRHLQEHCLIVGIGASATMVACFWVAMLGSFSVELGLGENWTNRSDVWTLVMALAGTAGLLFWLWTIYLMVRFAWSFARASRESKRAWRKSDRAIA